MILNLPYGQSYINLKDVCLHKSRLGAHNGQLWLHSIRDDLQEVVMTLEVCGQGLFSVYVWARSQPMREDITYVMSSLIG